MPHVTFKGNSSAYAFGFGYSIPPDPPGSYTHPNGYAGQAYQPQGHAVFTSVVIRGAGGASSNTGAGNQNAVQWGRGSTCTKTSVPVANCYIYTPTTASNGRIGQYDLSEGSPVGYHGTGGTGGLATMSNNFNGKRGGGVSVAKWGAASDGDIMVAAGGGGASHNGESQNRRMGSYEGQTSYPPGYNANRVTNTGNGANGLDGACYYGGGGGGGGFSRGGNGGENNSGGKAGGNGSTPDAANGTGSRGYSSITTDENGGHQYSATVSWG